MQEGTSTNSRRACFKLALARCAPAAQGLRAWFVLLLLMLFLSGCMTLHPTATINADGSGSITMTYGYTREFLASQADADLLFASIRRQAQGFQPAWQGTLEPWEDERYRGVRVMLHFADPAMLEAQLNYLLGPDSQEGAGGLCEAFEMRQDGTTLSLRTRVRQEASDTEASDLAPLLEGFAASLSVEMPTLTSFSAQEIATRTGNTVVWTFPPPTSVERVYTLEARGTLAEEPPAQQPPDTTPPGERCFAEVPDCISGRLRQFWEQNGGLEVFGLPISPRQQETIEGQPYQVQWFERNRLELHPENAPPYDVLTGRLGVALLEQQGRNWRDFAPLQPDAPAAECRYFEETGHFACGKILAAWRASGLELDGQPGTSEAESLALFGMPVTSPMVETLHDGQSYTVQYFERARFELHPENAPPHDVLLGLLGSNLYAPANNLP